MSIKVGKRKYFQIRFRKEKSLPEISPKRLKNVDILFFNFQYLIGEYFKQQNFFKKINRRSWISLDNVWYVYSIGDFQTSAITHTIYSPKVSNVLFKKSQLFNSLFD